MVLELRRREKLSQKVKSRVSLILDGLINTHRLNPSWAGVLAWRLGLGMFFS